MSKEQQIINEMALAICKSRGVAKVDDCSKCGRHADCLYYEIADSLYKADYRRQSEGEWISVDERLPKENGLYLVCVNISHLAFENLTTIAIMAYGISHGFYLYSDNEKVTHWMPLPEAPKKKGGAE